MKNTMKKIVGAAIVCILAAMLIGCGEDSGVALPESNYQPVQPNIVKIGNTDWDDEGFYYVVDKNTGVVYLGFDQYSKGGIGGISVMLNADGTPITAEQLGIEY